MKLIGTIFSTHKVKKLFEAENYTAQEFRDFMKSGGPIDSRHSNNIAYILRDSQISVIEKR